MTAREALVDGMLPRARLDAQLRGRFDRLLTVLVAGPGYGKTILLQQSLRQAGEPTLRVDLAHGVGPADRHYSEFAGALRGLLGVAPGAVAEPVAEAQLLADAVALRSPAEVCLIIDDVHALDGVASVELLAGLVAAMPANGHLVLSSREVPEVGVSMLVAAGRAVVLDQDDLAFATEEWTRYAAARGADAASEPVAWPALARLVVEGAPRTVLRSHLMYEVVRHLSAADRELLGAVITIGRCDDALVSAVLGRRVHLAERLDHVALVHPARNGDWVAHALWAATLDQLLTQERQSEIRTAAATVLSRRGRFSAAMELVSVNGDWRTGEQVAVAALADQPPAVAMDVVTAWHQELPESERERPVWRLVRALLSYEDSLRSARRQLDALDADLAASAEQATSALRVAVLFHLATVGRRTADEGLLLDVADRLQPIADAGDARALAILVSVAGFVDQIHGRTSAGLARFGAVDLAAVSPEQGAHVSMMEGNLLLLDGRIDRALHVYARAAELGSAPVRLLARELWATAAFVAGRGEAAIDAQRECLDTATRFGLRGRVAQFRAMLAAQLAMSGRFDEARGALDADDRREGLRSADTETAALTALTLALLALADGDRARAVELLRRIPPPDGNLQRALILPAAAVIALVPERRGAWNAIDAPLVAAAVRLGVEAGGGPTAAPDDSGLRAGLLPTLLRDTDGAPPPPVELDLLGPVTLRITGRPVDSPIWRRARVRELLVALTIDPVGDRGRIGERLWPTLDPPARLLNLRVTRSYLAGVFAAGPQSVKPLISTAASLRIDPALVRVDVERFESELARAARAERDGGPDEAINALTAAIGIYLGDLAQDLSADWLEDERIRLRQRFVDALVRCGELRVATGDPAEAARLADRASAADADDERASRLVAKARLALDDPAGALAALRKALQRCDLLGVEPEPATAELLLQVGGLVAR